MHVEKNKSTEGDKPMGIQLPNALPNRLKQLRKDSNLTIQTLAEQLKMSNAFINFLEAGKRGASDETLQKYADFFHCDFVELKELQKISVNVSEQKAPIEHPVELSEYLSFLMQFSEDFRQTYVKEQTEYLRKRYYDSLPKFDMGEIKKSIKKIKEVWFSIDADGDNLEEKNLIGTLQVPEKHIYFSLLISKNACSLQLLYEDNRFVDIFKTWLGEENISLIDLELVPQHHSEQKVKKFIWFSTSIPIKGQLHYMIDNEYSLHKVTCRDPQLNRSIKYYLNSDVEEAI